MEASGGQNKGPQQGASRNLGVASLPVFSRRLWDQPFNKLGELWISAVDWSQSVPTQHISRLILPKGHK